MITPAVALRGLCVLPKMAVNFEVSRDRSRKAVEQSMLSYGQKIFLIMQKDADTENPGMEDLYTVGVMADIRQVARVGSGRTSLLAVGRTPARLLSLSEDSDGYLLADVEPTDRGIDPETDEVTRDAMLAILRDELRVYLDGNTEIKKDLSRAMLQIEDVEELVDIVPIHVPFSNEERQKLLQTDDFPERYSLVVSLLTRENQVRRIRDELKDKVKAQVDKNQKEYILREQMKVIRNELGEDPVSEADELAQKIDELDCSDEVREKLKKELSRFRMMNGSAAEAAVQRNYLDTMLSLPWNKRTEESHDIKKAEEILERDHYGMKKVKDRVLEYLAVRSLRGVSDAPILCLVGPPGTGKTSIAKSVAEALNRTYVRLCLGGVHDEAEIRGHRKTYVGSMPGRVAEALMRAKTGNPLILLDEIDKLGSDYKGDPSSALLEVLDSEQNQNFRDHYTEVTIDLSDVLFIATANDAEEIPEPLFDRLEVIEVDGYTENEKLHIAKEHLIPKQEKKNGMRPGEITLPDETLLRLIREYTREAGVRSLERRIGQLCRKAVRAEETEGRTETTILPGELETYLGHEKRRFNPKNEEDAVGVVRGLAWTPAGGDTLEIEAIVTGGGGKLQLTGQMGEVMKESAQIALSYVRMISDAYGLAEDYYDTHDFHLHIPEGAVPKDGPSAGVTMTTAFASAVSGRPVLADLAMTGEITLTGRVLMIGGLKEKLLAAKQAGITRVLVPEQNRPDVKEMAAEITDGMEIVFVDHISKVLAEALVPAEEETK